MKRSLVVLLGMAMVTLASACSAQIANTLWVGVDPFGSNAPILNTDRTGAVLRSTNPLGGGNGIAVDIAGNNLYIGKFSVIQQENLTTLATIGPSRTQTPDQGTGPEDMTFDGTHIWRAVYGFNLVNEIDPATNTVIFSFTPPTFTGPVGIAWDGSGLWVGDFDRGHVAKFTTAGALVAGTDFVVSGLPSNVGGLGYDTTDKTLWIGSAGSVSHYTLAGTKLGSFSTPDGRFVDGLEFEGAPVVTGVPEPGLQTVLLSAVLGSFFAFRRRRHA